MRNVVKADDWNYELRAENSSLVASGTFVES